MDLKTFWLDLDALCNKSQAHPDIKIIICTLDKEYGVGSVEITKDVGGNFQIQINSDESY